MNSSAGRFIAPSSPGELVGFAERETPLAHQVVAVAPIVCSAFPDRLPRLRP
ncbi:hypothetical protein [Polymorphobacter multimanifer]|uniref:Uncharacterized protein n=1 Tax=Polymorphobacter multimanifer TaxID=1070431 RepID=A0A841L8R4_9SPHN|nr:hypothetical protein [Polymorphobacter multimanifer]MBB6227981.1 hypothetical protein [Polymorphobacter multimanifer]